MDKLAFLFRSFSRDLIRTKPTDFERLAVIYMNRAYELGRLSSADGERQDYESGSRPPPRRDDDKGGEADH